MLRNLSMIFVLAAVAACGGGGGGDGGTDDGGGGGGGSLSNLSYLLAQGLYRVGEAIAPNPATVTGTADSFSVDPALPGGLALNPTTGEITGTPGAEAAATQHTVTATNADGSTTTDVGITVGPQLPARVQSLALGFICEAVAEGLDRPTKIALAPDGRIFFTELDGLLRVIATDGTVSTIATETVGSGGHHGLIGLALDPNFAGNSWIYIQLTVDDTINPTFQQVVRWTDGTPATSRTNVLPNLPAAPTMADNNGGELHFDQTGALLISIGDISTPANAQLPSVNSLAGKILRVYPSPLSIPPDNPFPGDLEFCRGMRNCFGIAEHPGNGTIFAVDNGDGVMHDEINLLMGGQNFGWGNETAADGFMLTEYQTAIVPTALEWHDGAGWGAEFDDDLFMTTYIGHSVRRFEMTFTPGLAIDNETVWAQFVDNAGENNPLDIEIDRTTGNIYVATFSGIYRFSKQ